MTMPSMGRGCAKRSPSSVALVPVGKTFFWILLVLQIAVGNAWVHPIGL